MMSALTVRISEASHRILKELAERTGQTMTDVLREALVTYRRKVFVDAVNAGYAEMRADPQAWTEHLAERQEWDAAVADGLEPAEHWTDEGRCVNPDHAKE
jgi:predicted transcriptional regulator